MELYKSVTAEAKTKSEQFDVSSARDMKTIDNLIGALNSKDIAWNPTVSAVPKRCPILHTELVNPVKCSDCGHVYSQEGAISYLYQGMRKTTRKLPVRLDDVPAHFEARCPVAGCPVTLRAASLKRDFATELSQRQIREAAQTQDADVDVCEV